MKELTLQDKIKKLTEEMNGESTVFNCVDAGLFASNKKAGVMLNLLYKLHGSRNATKEGALSLVFKRIYEECGVDGHDGHFNIIKKDQLSRV